MTHAKKKLVDVQAVQDLVTVFNEGELSELEYISGDDVRIKIVKSQGRAHDYSSWSSVDTRPAFPQPAYASLPPASSAAVSENSVEDEVAAAPETASDETITSPVVGTVYVASGPESPPFVQVGDQIHAGDTVMIVELMKVMNPVKAPKSGRVTKICVENGRPVEYGEVLLRFAPA